MNLSRTSIKVLGDIIVGDHDLSPLYRKGYELVNFFNGFGAKEEYGDNFPSRWVFTDRMLQGFNNSDVIRDIILAAINPVHFPAEHPIEEIRFP